jgi:hypothetical protein
MQKIQHLKKKINFFLLALVLMVTSVFANNAAVNIDDKPIVKIWSEKCESKLNEYIAEKAKYKVDHTIGLNGLFNAATSAKLECSQTIPKEWEEELKAVINLISH